MAITITNMTSGSDSTTNPSTPASISPSANNPVYAVVAVAIDTNPFKASPAPSLTITGNNLTWTQIAEIAEWQGRRKLYVVRGIGASPSAGSPSVSWDQGGGTGGVWTETAWIFDQATGVDSGTPEGTVYTNITAGDTLGVTVSQTPDAGDWVYAAFANQESAGVMTISSELTAELAELTGMTDIRNLATYYSSSPDATPVPTVENTGTGNVDAGIAFILNVGSSQSQAPRSMHHFRQMMRG